MIKKEVKYTDFDGNPQSETLHFHITKADLLDNLDIRDEFDEFLKVSQGKERDLTEDEVRLLISIVRRVVKIAYGVRSADGKQFRKSEELWEDFRYSAAHDDFLFSLFDNPESAIEFLNGVFPSDLMAQAAKELETKKIDPETRTFVPKDDTPAYILENREPTNAELLNMSREEIVEAMRRKGQVDQ